MTNIKTNLSRLMKVSWDIQKTKHRTRSKALMAAWAILSNEDVTVQYLTRKLNKQKPLPHHVEQQFSLFAQ